MPSERYPLLWGEFASCVCGIEVVTVVSVVPAVGRDGVDVSVFEHVPSYSFIGVASRGELAAWVCGVEVIAIGWVVPAKDRDCSWLLGGIDVAGYSRSFVAIRESDLATEIKTVEAVSRHIVGCSEGWSREEGDGSVDVRREINCCLYRPRTVRGGSMLLLLLSEPSASFHA